MSIIERLRTLGVGSQHRITEVVMRGDHNVHPPLENIRKEVEQWLCSLLREEQVEITCTLEVERRRNITARPFIGVKVVCLASFNPQVIEIRVRPQKSEWQWNCHLICSDVEQATLIYFIAKPKNLVFLLQEEVKTVDSLQKSHHVFKRQQKCEKNELVSFSRLLKSRLRLREFCSALENSCNVYENIGLSDLHREICSIIGQPTNPSITLHKLVVQLVDDGIIDPHQEGHFTATLLFDEYVEDFVRQRQDDIAKQLQSDKDANARATDVSQRELTRLKQQIELVSKQLSEHIVRGQEIDTQIKKLHTECV